MMNKVIKMNYDCDLEVYVFDLEDGDKVVIEESNYNTIMIHYSEQGRKYKAIVDEHEDDYSAAIEYLAFEEI